MVILLLNGVPNDDCMQQLLLLAVWVTGISPEGAGQFALAFEASYAFERSD